MEGLSQMDTELLIELKPKSNIPDIDPGDNVKVSLKIKEGDRERIQIFQGVVTKVLKGKTRGNFTVRRVTYGIGVERTFFLNSPLLEKVEVTRQGKVRRARLFYLRGLSGKATRIKEKREKLAAKGIGADILSSEPVAAENPVVETEPKA